MSKPRCGANKADGSGTCSLAAGWQTDHPGVGNCKWHGGRTPGGKVGAKRQAAAQAVEALSIPVETTPEDALLAEVRHVAGDVAFLRQEVQRRGYDLTETVFTEGGSHDKPSTWLEMYWQAHDRLVRVASAAIKAGVEERRVRLAEQQQQETAEFMRRVVAAFGIPDTPATWETIRAQWQVIEGGAAG